MTTKLYVHNGHVFHTTQATPGAEIIVTYPPFPEGTGRVAIHPQPTRIQHYQGRVNSINHSSEWEYTDSLTDIDKVMQQVCRKLLGNQKVHLDRQPVNKTPLGDALTSWHNAQPDAPDQEDRE